MRRILLVMAAALALGAASNASAGVSVSVSVGWPGYVPPPPVAFVPRPVVVAPAPVCVPQPPAYVVYPRRVIVGPPLLPPPRHVVVHHGHRPVRGIHVGFGCGPVLRPRPWYAGW